MWCLFFLCQVKRPERESVQWLLVSDSSAIGGVFIYHEKEKEQNKTQKPPSSGPFVERVLFSDKNFLQNPTLSSPTNPRAAVHPIINRDRGGEGHIILLVKPSLHLGSPGACRESLVVIVHGVFSHKP